MNKKDLALIIFTKTPVEGQVKTRLISEWGTEGALLLYKDLLKKTLETAKLTALEDIYLFCSPTINDPFLSFCSKQYDVPLELQSGHDLGRKMYNAFEQKLIEYEKVILIGCDCPGITFHDIDTANKMLSDGKEIVLGPSEDGGYYLIGLVRNHPQLFNNINWGEGTVLDETRKRISSLNLEFSELQEKWDVDRPEDVHRYFNYQNSTLDVD